MSVDKVYLSIVKDSSALNYLRAVIGQRMKHEHDQYWRYAPVLKTLASKVGVIDDWIFLTPSECHQAWKLVIDYVYGDELAGLTNKLGSTPAITITEKETSMSVSVETKHFVSGSDVSTMTPDDLIRSIKNIEQEIKELKAVNIQSVYIGKKVDELRVTLGVVVGHLDDR
jgi:hypothetical protein